MHIHVWMEHIPSCLPHVVVQSLTLSLLVYRCWYPLTTTTDMVSVFHRTKEPSP